MQTFPALSGDRLDAALWVPSLTTRALGRGENLVLDQTDSTNLRMRALGFSGAPHGSLCIAEMQTAGRGRLDRSWHSPAGQGLWMSVLLRPALQPQDAPLITLAAALAMAQAVREVTGLDARIKWPNDLVLNGRKLCGILLEMHAEPGKVHHVVVGTGLNVRSGAYPPQLRAQATSLEDEGARCLRRDVLTAYLAALESALDRLEQGGLPAIEADYRALSCTLGQPVRVIGTEEFTGVAHAIDESGALLVRMQDGTLRRVLAGDVSVRGVMGYV